MLYCISKTPSDCIKMRMLNFLSYKFIYAQLQIVINIIFQYWHSGFLLLYRLGLYNRVQLSVLHLTHPPVRLGQIKPVVQNSLQKSKIGEGCKGRTRIERQNWEGLRKGKQGILGTAEKGSR